MECGSVNCDLLSNFAETDNGAGGLGEKSTGSWTHPESPVPADHRSLMGSKMGGDEELLQIAAQSKLFMRMFFFFVHQLRDGIST